MNTLILSKTAARRYVLGRQGLWPGRRWQGKAGIAAAITRIEAVQIDPLVAVARNHDIVLWSRVADYSPADLDALLYTDRLFFDYGSILMIYPMAELPYWRAVMRQRAEHSYWANFAATNASVIDSVTALLRERGPLGNRDFEAGERRVGAWRSTKDTGQALNYLWTVGDLMTHSRRKFERLYGFPADIVPSAHAHSVSLDEAEAHFARKALHDIGLGTLRAWANRIRVTLHRTVSPTEAKRVLAGLVEAGVAATATVEGSRETWYFPAHDTDILLALNDGIPPEAWQPIGATTHDEATFLAPLDNVIWDRARTQTIFDFDYIWEVYKPASVRKWGYYTLPVLYGDRFVARFDPKLDRTTGTLHILGYWQDAPELAESSTFAAALARGFGHFARFVGAKQIDLSALPHPLREGVEAHLP